MGSNLYSQRDVRRMMAVMGICVVVPCILLVALAWQSVSLLHDEAAAQRREACRHALQETGRTVQHRMEDELARMADGLRGQDPGASGFWVESGRCLAEHPDIQTVLALDSDGFLSDVAAGTETGLDLPMLSEVHPQSQGLRAARTAHWVENQPERAAELYREVLAGSLPAAVRLSCRAELAQCEEQLGKLPAAWEEYARLAKEPDTTYAPLLARLHGVELAMKAGEDAMAREWAAALLAACLQNGTDLGMDELHVIADRLGPLAASDSHGVLHHAWQELDWLIGAREAREAFRRTCGHGPFTWFGTKGFAPAVWPAFGGGDTAVSGDLLLVDVQNALPGGTWLALDVDMATWAVPMAEPFLRRMTADWGVCPVLASAGPGLPDGPSEDQVEAALPAPFDAWKLSCPIRAESMWATLAGSQTKTRAVVLGVAVGLALLGLLVPVGFMRRSLRLARLQADMLDRISHELKTPISSLSVLAETLEYRENGSSSDRQVRRLVYEEVQRLVRISGRLLDYARQRSGAAALDRIPGQLEKLVAEIAERLPMETGVERDRLVLEIQPGTYSGIYDQEAVREILANLVENAVKYSDAPAEVRIGLKKAGGMAVLEVSDKGCGMDAHTLRHIFTPYFRADNRLAMRVPGLGLGLAVVQGLVRGHDGTIAAQSAPGMGTTFEIQFPLDAGERGVS